VRALWTQLTLALQEMGLDDASEAAHDVIKRYDRKGRGVIDPEDFEEVSEVDTHRRGCGVPAAERSSFSFLLTRRESRGLALFPRPRHASLEKVYTKTPIGVYDWSHVDHARLARVERNAAANRARHPGHGALAAFLRKLDAGCHFIRVGAQGRPSHAGVRLTRQRDGLSFLFAAAERCSLPFSALRVVGAPFRDEHDDTLGLVPPHLAARCVLLVFAVAPEEDFALELGRAYQASRKARHQVKLHRSAASRSSPTSPQPPLFF